MWILHPSLENLIKEWWSVKVEGTAMFKVAKKLRNVKDNMKRWNRETFGNIFESKRRILEELMRFKTTSKRKATRMCL